MSLTSTGERRRPKISLNIVGETSKYLVNICPLFTKQRGDGGEYSYSKYPFILSKKPLSFLSGAGIKDSESLNFSKIFSSSLLILFGIQTLTLTRRSPRPYPFTSGSPFPRRRRIFPGWVPGSIFIFTLLSTVGTSTCVPSTASGISLIHI